MRDFQLAENISGNILEIGVFQGRFFIALSQCARSGELCLALDVFDEQDKNLDGAGVGDLDKLKSNIERFAPKDVKFVFLKADSLGLSAQQKISISAQHGLFRMISIDGCHTCEHTLNDLETSQDLLSTGGTVIVDDYYNMHWPGVHEGVGHFFSSHRSRLKPFLYCNNKLFLTSFAYHKRYLETFSKQFRQQPMFKVVSMYGSDVMVAR
jgi:hypothetical protein